MSTTHDHDGDSVGHEAHDSHDHHVHVIEPAVYLKVYGALLVLTYLTVQVSYWALGPLSLPMAMGVAVIKAALVIGFFMHLRYDVRFNSLVFFSSVLFVAIFFSLTMIDLVSRGDVSPEMETHALERQQEAVDSLTATPRPATEHGAESGGH